MSSPGLGFTPWRPGDPSVSSEETGDDSHPPILSPGRGSHLSTADPRALSSSVNSSSHREPIRSFVHGSVRDNLAPVDSAQHARSVREDTAELASYVLSDRKSGQSPAFLNRQRSYSSYQNRDASVSVVSDAEDDDGRTGTILEDEEPESPETVVDVGGYEGPSMLSRLLRSSPPQPQRDRLSPTARHRSKERRRESRRHSSVRTESSIPPLPIPSYPADEFTPLLQDDSASDSSYENGHDSVIDEEDQKPKRVRQWFGSRLTRSTRARVGETVKVVLNPRKWDRRAIWRNTIEAPISALPAVVVGLLLNILDAMSYGMILFPLGKPIFAGLGSAGISMFYVSTIVSQLTFSSSSVFKSSIGSELIEVVPFFHNMAQTITDSIGEDQPDAVIATSIVSFAISSMVTGTVFYLMGAFKFGYMAGFIPRHILIGCIGGVGWFLVATGFEVSARMDGSLEYDLDTLKRLVQPDTIPLWSIPFALATIVSILQTRIKSKYLMPGYILMIPAIFYFVVFLLRGVEPAFLRDRGWIFYGPPPGEPWWYFWTLYKFDLVYWGAVAETIPAMLALTFFGILHVPINVPALAAVAQEDNADLDHELRLHGYSNFLSGLVGSVQNYLVYANTVFFMRSGGDSRLAGFMLAFLTFGVMTVGPTIIGFIPVMVVGTLIFVLGFELLLDAIWVPRKKLKAAEYLTVITIVLVMGIYDFVVGIGVGIILALVTLVFQASRVPAIRGAFSGEIVGSTVRRNPSQQHYLHQVGRQIYMLKLTGFLFFGTIVSVEEKIRALIDDNTFARHPIRFLILDLWHVTGLDYSAGEAFNTVSRLVKKKDIDLVICGVDAESELGRALRAAGLAEEDPDDIIMLPDLNSALESCENELLKTFYASQKAMHDTQPSPSATLDVPGAREAPSQEPHNSPRRIHLQEAAQNSLTSVEVQRTSRWQSFKEPLRLMLQIFHGLSDKNEDFWFRAVPFFARREYGEGTILYKRGEPAEGFYLIEEGMLRGEYDLPQGWLSESVVAGTTCGELPFFSETDRTATVVVERQCVLWLMDMEGWEKLQREAPEVSRELLRVSLKLTSERMSAITSYILAMAG